MKQVTQEWLNFALTDLKNCEKILDDEFLTNIVAFHAQQAIEKCFKAVIEEYELGFIKTHDLIKLNDITKEYIEYKIDIDALKQINEIYIITRYPVDIGLLTDGKPSIKEAEYFYSIANEVYEKIIKELLKRIEHG